MKKLIFLLIFIKGALLSATVEYITIKDTKVPIIFEEDKTLPIVGMQLIFKNSGNLFGKKEGLSKFVASMMNEGTKKDGAVNFANKLEQNAISLSSATGNETFVFEMSSLKEQFKKGSNLLKELLSDPNFTDKTLKKVKLLKISQIKQKESDYDYIASLNLRKILFPNTPLARSFIGSIESIKSITLDDVKDFYKNHFVLKKAVVVIGGDLDIKEAKEYVKNILSPLEDGDIKPLPYYKANENPTKKEVYKDTKQAYIYFGAPYHLSPTSKDYYKARVATFILGSGGFGSRLMEEIRVKRGLAYSAYVSLYVNMTNSSIRGYLQTKIQNQDEAIKLVKKIFMDFVKNGVTKKELEAAKKFILGSEPLRNETLSQRLNKAFMLFYKGLDLDYDKKELQKIQDLKLEDLNQYIKSHPEINKLSFSIVTKEQN